MRDLDKIMREDAKRRLVREAEEMAAFVAAKTKPRFKNGRQYVNPELVQGIGIITPPRQTSASDNCWKRGMRGRTVGIVTEGENLVPVTDYPSMKVTKDGVTTIVPITSTRTRKSRKRNTANAASPHRTTAADLAPIQNASQDS